MPFALFLSAAIVIALRFTVPGHGLTKRGTYDAVALIAAGVAGGLLLDKAPWLAFAVFLIALAILSWRDRVWAAIYEHAAHIWVGALIAIAIIFPALRWEAIALVVFASLVELAAFLTQAPAGDSIAWRTVKGVVAIVALAGVFLCLELADPATWAIAALFNR
jgi:hypothetical protein